MEKAENRVLCFTRYTHAATAGGGLWGFSPSAHVPLAVLAPGVLRNNFFICGSMLLYGTCFVICQCFVGLIEFSDMAAFTFFIMPQVCAASLEAVLSCGVLAGNFFGHGRFHYSTMPAVLLLPSGICGTAGDSGLMFHYGVLGGMYRLR